MKQRKLSSALLTMLMLCLMILSSLTMRIEAAPDVNEAVLASRSGIVQVNVSHVDSSGRSHLIQGGSGFLVGDESGTQTVITNYHIVHPTTATQEAAAEYYDVERLNMSIEVVVKRDVVLTAKVINESQQSDFAILELEQPIYDRTPLKISSSTNISETQDVYALGFYESVTWSQDVKYFDSEDVNVTKGAVSKKATVNTIDYIQHSAIITDGNSGGPLVDTNGAVVGLNALGVNDDYYYSIEIDEITTILKALGIDFVEFRPDDPVDPIDPIDPVDPIDPILPVDPVDPVDSTLVSALESKIREAEAKITDEYTDDSIAVFNSYINAAKGVLANENVTNDELQTAINNLEGSEEVLIRKQSNMTIWIVIAVVIVVVIIAVIIILVVVLGKKSRNDAPPSPHSGGTPAPFPGPNVYPPSGGGQSPGPIYKPPIVSEGSGETSVLNEGSGETTVLSSGMGNVMPASLIRTQNNESIPIRKQNFRVGKERNKVDYCIHNNTSVSRVHADIVSKNGNYYIIDRNTTNHTFINDVKIDPNMEMQLHDGDRIRFSDEEFTFRLG